jgi:outer membrane protein TolC
LYPQVAGEANLTGGKDSNSQQRVNFLLLSADAAFQVDLFGRLRRATDASRADLATEDAKQTVILTLVSDICRSRCASPTFATRATTTYLEVLDG